MPSFLFGCFSLFLPHLRTLAHEKRPEKIVFVWGLVGRVSVSIIVAKYNIFPRADNGRSREKILAKRFADAISEHCRDLEHAYVY